MLTDTITPGTLFTPDHAESAAPPLIPAQRVSPEGRIGRRLVVSPGGMTFLICKGCDHWVARHSVIGCSCCMTHPDRPDAPVVTVEELDEDENVFHIDN